MTILGYRGVQRLWTMGSVQRYLAENRDPDPHPIDYAYPYICGPGDRWIQEWFWSALCMCGHDIDGTLNTGGGSALRCLSIDDFVAAPRLAWRQPVNLGRLSRVQVSSEPGNTATSSVPSSLMSAGRTHAMRVGVD